MEKSFLATHMRTHTGELPYKCKKCTDTFKSKEELRQHQEKEHNDLKPFVCLKCKAKFSKYNALKVHQKIHAGQKPFSCPYPGCERCFVEKGNMKTHFKVHVTIYIYFQENFQSYLELIDDTTLLKNDKSEEQSVTTSSKEVVNNLQTKTFTSINLENEKDISSASTKIIEEVNNAKPSTIGHTLLLNKLNDFSTYIDSYSNCLTNTNSFYSKCNYIIND